MQHIKDMEGMHMVRNAIMQEYQKGSGRLPASEFSHLLQTSVEVLLQKLDKTLMNWISILQQGYTYG